MIKIITKYSSSLIVHDFAKASLWENRGLLNAINACNHFNGFKRNGTQVPRSSVPKCAMQGTRDCVKENKLMKI